MTVSMLTTRLSWVMTGCGGKLTTCSRRSRSGSSRSTNGVTMFSPACRVRWYRPNRSTMPALAWGTMRTDRLITTTTRMTKTTSRMVATRELMAASLLRPVRGSGGFRVSGLICYVTDRERVEPACGNSVLATGDAPRSARPGGPARLPVLDLQLDAEAPGQVPRGEDLLDRAGREHRAAAQQHGVGEAVGYLFDMVGDQHHHRRLGIAGQLGEPPQQVLAAAQVEPRGRLVEQQQLRVGHQRPGDLHPLALALRQRGELAPDQVRAAERVEYLHRAGDVGGVVFLFPPAQDGVGGGEHQVDDLLPGRDLLGDRGAGPPDPRPQVEDVDLAETLAEDLDGALGGEHQGGCHLKQGGLARPVRSDQDPPLVPVRRPVHVAQQDRRVPPDLDAPQPQHLVGHQAPFLRTRAMDPVARMAAETEPMPPHPRKPSQTDRYMRPASGPSGNLAW